MKQTAKLMANGRYVVMIENENRSEKGVKRIEERIEEPDKSTFLARNVQEEPDKSTSLARNVQVRFEKTQPTVEYTRTLYDTLRDTATRSESYRQAHPSEISEPTEFTTYLRDAGPAPKSKKKARLDLPTVEESMETLYADTLYNSLSPENRNTLAQGR